MKATTAQGRRILVSTNSVADGEQIVRLLKVDFPHVKLSSSPERAISDFEEVQPDVLVLAFDKLEDAQRYYLGLYRLSRSVHALRHRTILLCSKDEVQAAFELCKKDYFDDYVLHWPQAYDGRRLSMSVWIACREHTAGDHDGPPRSQLRAHAQHLGELERILDRELAGGEHPQWTRSLREQIEPSLAATRPLAAKFGATRVLLLAVEDDELTRRLLSMALDPAAYEIRFVGDAQEALRLLRHLRPEAILMDIRLPGIDGVSLTEKLKASPTLADIPIIMMSGDSRVETLMRSIEVGASAFIVKPFSRQALTMKLEKVLQP